MNDEEKLAAIRQYVEAGLYSGKSSNATDEDEIVDRICRDILEILDMEEFDDE